MAKKQKTYEFSNSGLQKAIIDRKSEVTGRYINIAMWGVIGGMGIGGAISHYGIVKILACSGTSKVVKLLINLI